MPSASNPDDDQHWLDLLAGRSAPDALSSTRQDAAWLRAALLAYRVQAPPGEPSPPELRIERLLQRARAAGVLPETPAPRGGRRRLRDLIFGQSRPIRLGALAALITVVATVGVQLMLPPATTDSPIIERGSALQTRSTRDPSGDRQAMQLALRQAGIEAVPYERLGRPGLDIELPQPLSQAHRQALRRLGLAPPDGPALRVEFVATNGQP